RTEIKLPAIAGLSLIETLATQIALSLETHFCQNLMELRQVFGLPLHVYTALVGVHHIGYCRAKSTEDRPQVKNMRRWHPQFICDKCTKHWAIASKAKQRHIAGV